MRDGMKLLGPSWTHQSHGDVQGLAPLSPAAETKKLEPRQAEPSQLPSL